MKVDVTYECLKEDAGGATSKGEAKKQVQTQPLRQERAGLILGNERWSGCPNVISEEEADTE